jgi:hypothetical protein
VDADDELMEALKCLEVDVSEAELMALGLRQRRMEPALDSGAGEHVASPEDIAGFEIRESAGSKAGRAFIAANGDRIDNLGEVPVKLKEKDGITFGSVFQVADVTRPLYSVGRICDNGCTVSFNSSKAVVMKDGKRMATFNRKGGLYLADFELLPPDNKGDGTAQPFTRQGAGK